MIHIFYRHYNISGRENWRPEWFTYEKCFDNLINSISDLNNVKITIVYDGENDDNFVFEKKIDVININAKSDYESFKKTLDIINNSNINNSDIIYLLENDYLHVKGWDIKVKEFFNESDNCYLSLYDHNDKYFETNNDLRSKIVIRGSHHYRTTPSTCGSFLVRKNVLMDDYYLHYNITNFISDITKMPIDHSKFMLLKTFANRDVYTPIPGLSTHCLNGLLSPVVKWGEI